MLRCVWELSLSIIWGLSGQGYLRHMLTILGFCRVQWVALS